MQTDLDILDTDVVELEVPGSASLIKRAEWGHIVGDISNQEDLNSILNTKPSRAEIDDILTNYRTSEEQDIIDNSKAKDVEVVHTFGNEVINGNKTFNSDIHFNSKVSVGGSVAGTKAFKITKVSQDKKTFTFENTNGIELDFEGNIYIYDGNTDTNYMFFGNVSVIDGNDISFDKEIPWEGGLDLVNSYIWFTGHPEIGDISIGLYAFAEGYNTMANQIGGHSEGINTISAGKYSHAEGLGTLAGYAAHAQGRDTKARGLYSDASGRASEANGDYSIAGIQGKANADNAISVGTSTEANAKYAIATGHGTIANKEDQIVCGKYNDHTSDALFMIGDGRSNENRHNAFEVHNDSIRINGSILSKEKVNKIDEIPLNIKDAEGNRSVVSGYQNEAPAACAFAGGATSKANHDYSLAYGVRLETGKQDQIVFGRDNEVSNDALLVIGAGTSSKKANAFEVRNNSIKIGKSILEAPNKSGVFAITDDVDSSGHRIELVLDEETYQLRCELIDKNGNLISTSSVIDLPIESLVTGGYYDSIHKIIVLELKDGHTIDIPVSDLVSDLQEKITSSNKLSSDLIDDISSTNKFVSENDKNNWNNKVNNIKDGTGLNSLVQKTNAGVENTASGAYSSAIGRMNSATANYSFAGGNESNADVQGSFAYGQGVRTSPGAGYSQIVLGRYNADNKDAIFILGKGNSTDRKNAFEILRNGIKIGNNLLLENDIPVLEKDTNKVTSIDSESTDIQYPSAKAVFSEIEKNKKEIKSISNSSADLQTVLSTGPNSSGTYCRLMPYNNEKMYLWLDNKYNILTKVNGKWEISSEGLLFTNNQESDETHTITEIANAFGILSPNNDGRVIVFFRCHGKRMADIIDDSTGETITEEIPYYSIRAKVSNTDGTFDTSTQKASTVMWSTENDEVVNNISRIHKLSDGTYTCTYYTNGGTISVWEPWADTSSSYVYFSKIRHSDTGKNFVYLKDGNYPANDTCQDICKQQFIITNGTISSSGTMSYVINGYKRVDMDGVLNKNTRVGMVSFTKIKDSTKYLGIVESSVNLKASKPRPMCVQLFECRDISYSTLSPTTPKTILLPDEGESRGAPYITTLDDGRIAISFMSSQEFTGNKNTVSSFNNIWSVYVSKIPVTAGMLELDLFDDSLFVKLDFNDFSESQWGRWGSINNIDGKLYKTFTYGYNDNNGAEHRYGNLVIYDGGLKGIQDIDEIINRVINAAIANNY